MADSVSLTPHHLLAVRLHRLAVNLRHYRAMDPAVGSSLSLSRHHFHLYYPDLVYIDCVLRDHHGALAACLICAWMDVKEPAPVLQLVLAYQGWGGKLLVQRFSWGNQFRDPILSFDLLVFEGLSIPYQLSL